eukprot:14042744-Alexandrium_andersonii.AAC.1
MAKGRLPRQRLAGAPSEPPPSGCRAIGESALTERRGSQCAPVEGVRPRKGRESGIVPRPVRRLSPSCAVLTNKLTRRCNET